MHSRHRGSTTCWRCRGKTSSSSASGSSASRTWQGSRGPSVTRSRSPRSSPTPSPSGGSPPSCAPRWPAVWRRWPGCSRARATAGTRWPLERSCFSRGRRDPSSSRDSSSRSRRSRRSSSSCRAFGPSHEGYPVPRWLVEVVGISTACGLVTAPILWLQFGTIPLWTVPANALAEPAMPLLLGAGLSAAVMAPVIPPAAVALSWLAGIAAAWIAFSARLIGLAALRTDIVPLSRPRPRRSGSGRCRSQGAPAVSTARGSR